MSLKVYNTATRSVDEFEPLEQGRVRVYACGPTIYDRLPLLIKNSHPFNGLLYWLSFGIWYTGIWSGVITKYAS